MNKPPEMAALGKPCEVADYVRSSVATLAQLR